MSNKIIGLNGQHQIQAVKAPAGQLYEFHMELESGKNTIWNLLLKKQIRDFYNQNGLVLSGILREVKEIQKEFLQHEGENVKMIDNKPVFREGKTEEELNKKWEELMNRQINMII